MIITIDGPAGSGKSTAARNLAAALGVSFLDSGATYRALTLLAMRSATDLGDAQALVKLAGTMDLSMEPKDGAVRVRLGDEDVSEAIRSEAVSENTGAVAGSPPVREILVALQRKMGAELGDFVTEGRDQGTVVFPRADLKFFIQADPNARAERRCEQLRAAGQEGELQKVLDGITRRDQRDEGRKVAPLKIPPGAIRIDTTDNTIPETLEELLGHIPDHLTGEARE